MDSLTEKEVLEYIKNTDQVITEYKEAAASACAKNEELEAENLRLTQMHKQASTVETVLPIDAVRSSMENCVKAGFITSNDKEAHVEAIHNKPEMALDLLTKLAAGTLELKAATAKPLGTVVEKQAGNGTPSGNTANENVSAADAFFESTFKV